jgi:F-type H+-transporting ATPase subunit epsilon
MEYEKIALTVVTPRGHLVHAGQTGLLVDEVTAAGALGEFGVLPGHVPMLTYLKPGAVVYRQGNEIRWLAVRGGVAMVGPDHMTILADAAEHAEDIDVERAKTALRNAAQKLESGGLLDDPDYLKAQRKHERALVRLAVAEKARKVV